MKLRVAWRNLKNYVKYDLKEIAFPSSLPDPPSFHANKPKTRKLGFKDYVHILKTAASLHAKSYTKEGLTKEDWKKAGLDEEDDPEFAQKKETAEPSSVEELALAARAGAEHIKPALQRIYMTRATAYRDALKSFVEGYQEGIAEIMEQKSQTSSMTAETEPNEAGDMSSTSSGVRNNEQGKDSPI